MPGLDGWKQCDYSASRKVVGTCQSISSKRRGRGKNNVFRAIGPARRYIRKPLDADACSSRFRSGAFARRARARSGARGGREAGASTDGRAGGGKCARHAKMRAEGPPRQRLHDFRLSHRPHRAATVPCSDSPEPLLGRTLARPADAFEVAMMDPSNASSVKRQIGPPRRADAL